MAETIAEVSVQFFEAFVIFCNADESNGIALTKLNSYRWLHAIFRSQADEVERAGSVINVG